MIVSVLCAKTEKELAEIRSQNETEVCAGLADFFVTQGVSSIRAKELAEDTIERSQPFNNLIVYYTPEKGQED